MSCRSRCSNPTGPGGPAVSSARWFPVQFPSSVAVSQAGQVRVGSIRTSPPGVHQIHEILVGSLGSASRAARNFPHHVCGSNPLGAVEVGAGRQHARSRRELPAHPSGRPPEPRSRQARASSPGSHRPLDRDGLVTVRQLHDDDLVLAHSADVIGPVRPRTLVAPEARPIAVDSGSRRSGSCRVETVATPLPGCPRPADLERVRR